jgi:hypothetical protein
MYQLEVFQLNLTLRPVQSAAGASCEVAVYGDLRPGLRKNLVADRWIAGSIAAAGAFVGGAAGATGLALGGLAFLPAIGVAALLGGGSLAAYRWSYRHALRKGLEEIEGMLSALETHLRSQQLFGAPPPTPQTPPQRPPDDGGFIVAIG